MWLKKMWSNFKEGVAYGGIKARAVYLMDQMIIEQCITLQLYVKGSNEKLRLIGYRPAKAGIHAFEFYALIPNTGVITWAEEKNVVLTQEVVDVWEAELARWVDSREQQVVFDRISNMQSLSAWPGEKYQVFFKNAEESHVPTMSMYNPFQGDYVGFLEGLKAVWFYHIPGMFKSLGYVVTDITEVRKT